jgi:hypothetical protein
LANSARGASVDAVTMYEIGDSHPDPLQALVFLPGAARARSLRRAER